MNLYASSKSRQVPESRTRMNFETLELDLDRMPRILDPLSGSFAPWLPELPPRPFDSVQVEKNRLSRACAVGLVNAPQLSLFIPF
jgi:hypothetical protein